MMFDKTMFARRRSLLYRIASVGTALLAISLSFLPSAIAQEQKIGGHVGFVLPLVTHANGQTSSLGDNFSIGFPLGVTFQGQGRMAYDLELVPGIQDHPRASTLTVHPGLVWSLGHNWAAGMRLALDTGSSQFGFTPLVNKSFPIKRPNGFFKAYFVEAVMPVRFNRPTGGPSSNPVTFGLHFGVGF
jgi:hypothetical protein